MVQGNGVLKIEKSEEEEEKKETVPIYWRDTWSHLGLVWASGGPLFQQKGTICFYFAHKHGDSSM